MQTPLLSRRHALMTAAALPLATMLPRGASAAAALLGSASAGFNRFRLGAFEVTTLMAGSRTVEKPQESFGLNVSPEDFAAAATANFIPADKAQFYFSLDGQKWTVIGNELKMSYTLPHFMGYRFGLFNYATKTAGGHAEFDFFRVSDQPTASK